MDITCYHCNNTRGSFIEIGGRWYCLRHFRRYDAVGGGIFRPSENHVSLQFNTAELREADPQCPYRREWRQCVKTVGHGGQHKTVER